MARWAWFSKFGPGDPKEAIAFCQCCGGAMKWEDCDAGHKRDASLGGPSDRENLFAIHRFCNSWMDTRITAKREAQASDACIQDGGKVQWTAETWKDLVKYLREARAWWAPVLPGCLRVVSSNFEETVEFPEGSSNDFPASDVPPSSASSSPELTPLFPPSTPSPEPSRSIPPTFSRAEDEDPGA